MLSSGRTAPGNTEEGVRVSLVYDHVQVRVGHGSAAGGGSRLTTGNASFTVHQNCNLVGEFLCDPIVGAAAGDLIAFMRTLPDGGVQYFRGVHTMLLGTESDQIHVWAGTYGSPGGFVDDARDDTAIGRVLLGYTWSMVGSVSAWSGPELDERVRSVILRLRPARAQGRGPGQVAPNPREGAGTYDRS